MRYLLDTNILSEGRKPKPSPKVLSWLLQNAPSSGLSILTIGEFIKGASLMPAGKRRRELEAWIGELEQEFTDRLLPLDLNEIRFWGQLYGKQQAAGHKMPLFDSLLAATALAHDLTLVTRNTADFEDTDVRVLNPFV
jgi:predicted nucleic acid-binding protein